MSWHFVAVCGDHHRTWEIPNRDFGAFDTFRYPWIPLDTFGYPWIPLWLSCEPWRRAPGKLGASPSEEASETFGSKTYLAGVGNKLTKHLLEYWDVNNGKRGQTSHLWEKTEEKSVDDNGSRTHKNDT